jgi:hypothetical protein
MKCKLHGKTLIETIAFKTAADWTPDSNSLKIISKFPSSVHFDYSLHADQWHTIPEMITYCPDCESQARIERLSA